MGNLWERKKIVIVIGVAVLLVVAFTLFLVLQKPQSAPPVVETPTVTEPVIVQPTAPVEDTPIAQDETLSILRGNIKEVHNLDNKIEYVVFIGGGENMTETIVTADRNTLIFDTSSQKIVLPSNLTVNTKVVLYTVGKYTVGNLVASAIVLGEDLSYKYNTVKTVTNTSDGVYLVELDNSTDVLQIDLNTNILNAYTGIYADDISVTGLADRVLFKYSPEFEITPTGNVYTCVELVLLSTKEEK